MTDVPELQMLWEAEDPRRALGGRLGFADGQAAARWVLAVLDFEEARVDHAVAELSRAPPSCWARGSATGAP